MTTKLRKTSLPVASTSGAQNRKRAIFLLALVAKRKDDATRAFYDIGVALRELLRKKLYAPLGHPNFGAMLKAHGVMSKAFAFRLVGVVEAFTREQAIELGQKKAMSLVRLARATAADDTPSGLAKGNVIVDGKPVPARKLSGAAIERQAKRVRKNRRAATDDPVREAAHDAARRAAGILKRRRVAATIEVAERKGRYVAVIEIGIDALTRFLGAGEKK